MENSVLSKTISYLRFPLMVGVVLIHFNIADGFVMQGITYGSENPIWYHTIIVLFSQVLASIGVPLFFFFSGFLFFYHTDWNLAAYKRKLKTRARTLLVPYFLWNVIAIAWSAVRLLPCLAKIFPIAGKRSVDLSLSAIAYTFWDRSQGIFVSPIEEMAEDINKHIYPMDVPLWYVRDLMIVIVCAPLLYVLLKKAGCLLPVILGLVWYFIYPYNLGYPHQLLTAFFFFSWGAYYSVQQLDFTVIFRKFPFLPVLYIVVVVADTISKEQSYNSYIHDVGILLGIVSAIIITATLLERGKVRVNYFLASSSFFLFALHTLILSDLGKIIFAPVRSGSPYFLIVFYFLVPALTILICLGLYKVLKTYFPAFTLLLTGGR